MSNDLSTRRSLFIALLAAATGLTLLGISSRLSAGLEAILQLETSDPLFDFPGLALADWPDVISTVKDANNTVMPELPQHVASYRLYPERFWEAASNVAAARQRFLDWPSWRGAWQLLNAEKHAASAYVQDFERFREFWRSALAENEKLLVSKPLFVFIPGRATDVATMNAALESFHENGQALNQEIALRWQCLVFGLCRSLLRSRVAAIEIHQPAKTSTTNQLLPPAYLESTRVAYGAVRLDDRIFSIRTGCFGQPGELSHFLLWSLPGNDDGRRGIFFPKLATNSFFRPIQRDRRYPQDELPYRAGYQYAAQVETFWYLCPELSYYPHLASMYTLVVAAQEMPLASVLASFLSPSLADELRMREVELTKAKRIDDAMVNGYIEMLRRAREQLNQADRSATPLSTLEERIRWWETKSGGLIGVLRGLTLDAQTFSNTAQTSRGQDLTLALTAAVARAHSSLLYAAWNPSVWRLDNAPRLLFADTQPRRHLVDYWMLRTELGEAALREIQRLTSLGAVRH